MEDMKLLAVVEHMAQDQRMSKSVITHAEKQTSQKIILLSARNVRINIIAVINTLKGV